MEHLTLTTAVVVAGGSLAFALALLTAHDGIRPSPWQLLASYALTFPAQFVLAGLALFLYVGIQCVDPERLRNFVVASGTLLAVVTGAHVRRILAASAPTTARALAISGVACLGGLALALLLGATYG